jgi:hypothetical protein
VETPEPDRRVSTELVRYDAMCQAIASAYEVDEIKDIRDRAIALEHYSRLAHNVEAERQCCEIRLRAERKAGKLLQQMEKAKGGRPPKNPSNGTRGFDEPKTLDKMGITYDQSTQWQQLADVAEPDFEAALGGPDKPTTSGIINRAKPKEITPVSDQALWLWGRLRDFERHQLLPISPIEVLATMTPEMLQDVTELAPRVAIWLNRIGGNNGT